MENLSRHIEKLLARHDYVVVPDFGGFVVQQQSADVLSDKIIAPYATIGFNPLMLHGDGLLAIEISRSEQISYRQAMDLLKKEVEALKLILKLNESVQLGSIGMIRLDDSGNVIFLPAEKVEFLPQNFGLSDIYVLEREQIRIEKRHEITISLPSRRIYKYVATILLVLGLFFVSERVSDVSQPNCASFVPVFSEKTKINSITEQPNLQKNEDEQSSEMQSPAILKNYHVIVASLHDKVSADNFCNELIEADFKEAHVLDPIRTFRVAIQSFSDKQEAIKFMEKLRKTDEKFETCWVLCN